VITAKDGPPQRQREAAQSRLENGLRTPPDTPVDWINIGSGQRVARLGWGEAWIQRSGVSVLPVEAPKKHIARLSSHRFFMALAASLPTTTGTSAPSFMHMFGLLSGMTHARTVVGPTNG
jgi:hypothetical protein